jgi:hypothetical protein
MESILQTVSLEPMEITYLGIGSSPHLCPGQVLEPKYDQLIPQCFHEFLLKDKKHMRILHFDPDFANCVEFLHAYFEKWGLIPMECSSGMSWIGETMEVIVIPERIDHEEHFGFFHTLCETIVQRKGKLVIQEYTGYDLKPLNEKLYEAATNKELFKRRVLLDMTYGTDTGCCTDMTKAQPFYDFDLNFLNLHFMTDEDAKRWVHISLKLDDIIKRKYVAKYLQVLNNIHVDYRRRLKGEPSMFGHSLYTNESSPDEIMRVLQESLRTPFEILLKLQFVDRENQNTFQSLCLTYKGADPYKWYDAMRKVIPFL